MRTEERAPSHFEQQLLDELLALVAERPAAEPAPRRISRVRIAGAAAVAVAAITAVGGLSLGEHRPLPSGPSQAWAASALRVANAVPRLAIGKPGWRVVRADEFAVDQGEMTFTDGRHSLDLHWRDGDSHEGYMDDRAADAHALEEAEVDGARVRVFRYRGTPDDHTALWRSNGYSLELRTGLSDPEDRLDEEAFRAVLTSLKRVDVDTWLAAMPPTVVRHDARQAAIREMLDGIPLPDGFRREQISFESAIADRYQLGARVTGAVACAWISQWVRARRTGNDEAAAAAVAAMGTSRDWPVLVEMSQQGFFPEAVWEYADAIAGNGTVLGGRVLTVEESYEEGLGCGR